MSTIDTKQVPHCFYCGETLCFDGDFDASDIFPSNFKDDESATVSYYHCPNCGRGYEILVSLSLCKKKKVNST